MIDLRFNYPHLDCQYAHLSECLAIEAGKANADRLQHLQTLSAHAATWLSQPEHRVNSSQILTTHGGSHALSVIAQVADIVRQVVVVDPLTYHGFIRLAFLSKIRLVVCPIDDQGFVPNELTAICERCVVKAFYMIPTIHNPLCGLPNACGASEINRSSRTQIQR
ncbi:aminotransferase class I/II-fold pyridoxal phosphate-dependent enzyme [Dyadobacter sp. CY261]|uniref:aminotransferase class I/II-fold pyridoxal phosphate-dependent enzyme n=1 Tax=Dyadobacter sp. CY261 TaxID=2907203 RepID=UPI001F2E0BA2|nr:aminotransferase class I/II-fold pyridoxal phosphate-dependent enzyme [Dyadobacter sp. CY261]MCF0070455.1 aminotransferase class I/II-fold pyridoxal phosphate-dependent enzyme [Dyadobacter sp. CY261]